MDGRRESTHILDAHSRDALWCAVATERPLLVAGAPGMGKTQLARVAATLLERTLLTCTIDSSTEPQALRYQMDSLARLADAQMLAHMPVADASSHRESLSPARYLAPGPLWWAFDPASAADHLLSSNLRWASPWRASDLNRPVVLLIDEIDKADHALPNSLLEALGSGTFSVPYIGEPIKMNRGLAAPIVIITTNEDKEMPAPFLRRCLVHRIEMPSDEASWLMECGRAHVTSWQASKQIRPRQSAEVEALLRQATDLMLRYRRDAARTDSREPAISEFLDFLRVIFSHDDAHEPVASILNRMSQFIFAKQQLVT